MKSKLYSGRTLCSVVLLMVAANGGIQPLLGMGQFPVQENIPQAAPGAAATEGERLAKEVVAKLDQTYYRLWQDQVSGFDAIYDVNERRPAPRDRPDRLQRCRGRRRGLQDEAARGRPECHAAGSDARDSVAGIVGEGVLGRKDQRHPDRGFIHPLCQGPPGGRQLADQHGLGGLLPAAPV